MCNQEQFGAARSDRDTGSPSAANHSAQHIPVQPPAPSQSTIGALSSGVMPALPGHSEDKFEPTTSIPSPHQDCRNLTPQPTDLNPRQRLELLGPIKRLLVDTFHQQRTTFRNSWIATAGSLTIVVGANALAAGLGNSSSWVFALVGVATSYSWYPLFFGLNYLTVDRKQLAQLDSQERRAAATKLSLGSLAAVVAMESLWAGFYGGSILILSANGFSPLAATITGYLVVAGVFNLFIPIGKQLIDRWAGLAREGAGLQKKE